MRINENAMFPHPILKEDATDYQEGKLCFSIEIKYVTDHDFILKTNTEVNQKELEVMINKKKVNVALDIECQATYFSDLIQIKLGNYELPPYTDNEFMGNVDTRLLLYSNVEINDYFSPDFHSDFGKEKFFIRQGDILGFSRINSYTFKFPKISYDQIFELKMGGEDFPENEFNIMMDEDEKIQIIAGSNIFSKIQEARNLGWGKNLNLSSIYPMSLMEVIYSIKNNPGIYNDRKWYAVLDQTLIIIGFDLNEPDDLDPLSAAQAVFDFPYNQSFEGIKTWTSTN